MAFLAIVATNTQHYVVCCWATCQVNNKTILSAAQKCFHGKFTSPATITYWGLHVKWPTFWSDFNEIWTFSADTHESLQYQISRKFVQWDPDWYMRTDRNDGANWRLKARDYSSRHALQQNRISDVAGINHWSTTAETAAHELSTIFTFPLLLTQSSWHNFNSLLKALTGGSFQIFIYIVSHSRAILR